MTWNFESSYSNSYTNVMQGVDNFLTTSSSSTSVEAALETTLEDVIGSNGDRPDAPNVVLVMADGGGTSSNMPFLDELQNHARMLAVNIENNDWGARAPVFDLT